MANSFRPRSWKLRSDAAKYRKARETSMADIRAVRAALIHGEPVPAEALARTNGAVVPAAPEVDPTIAAEPATPPAPEPAASPAHKPRKPKAE